MGEESVGDVTLLFSFFACWAKFSLLSKRTPRDLDIFLICKDMLLKDN
jgi:hypothetical protein